MAGNRTVPAQWYGSSRPETVSLAELVRDARELVDEMRQSTSDPLVHAGGEALTAADILFRLVATHEQARPETVGRLREALDSVRAASVAVRFAVAEAGDRDRRAARSQEPPRAA